MLGAEGEALRWFPYPWEGGNGSNPRGTSAARPTDSSADTPGADVSGVPSAEGAEHGMDPSPLPVDEVPSSFSSSPSPPSSGRCIINPAVYGPSVEGADASAACPGARTGARQPEGRAVLRSLNEAATLAIAAGVARAGTAGAAFSSIGKSVAAGEEAGSRVGERFKEDVGAVAETNSPGPGRPVGVGRENGEGLAVAPETTSLVEGAGAVRMKASSKVSHRSDSALVRGGRGFRAVVHDCPSLVLSFPCPCPVSLLFCVFSRGVFGVAIRILFYPTSTRPPTIGL